MRGVSGVGKSTYVKNTYPDAYVYTTDDYFGDDYDFDPRKLPQAHQWCIGRVLRALQEELPLIVVDNTHVKRWEYENYILMGELAGYDVQIIEFPVKTVAQLKAITKRSAHGVPPEITARKIIEFEHDPRAIELDIET
jgi:predicted kinase